MFTYIKNKHITKFMIFSIVFIVFQLLVVSVNAASGMTDLGTLGGTYSNAYSINEMGQVVGESFDIDNRLKAFIWENGVMKDLGAGSNSSAKAINNKGQVVGFMTVNNRMHAFLWENGTITDLNPSGVNASCAFDINDKGQIVGWVHIGMQQVAAVWENGIMKILYAHDKYLASANKINEKGQVIINCLSTNEDLEDYGFVLENGIKKEVNFGQSLMDLNESGQVVSYKYLYDNGAITVLSDLGGNSSNAYSINDKSKIVGSSTTSANDHHAVIWDNGSIKDLGILGGSSSCAMDINNKDQVVGNSTTGSSADQHAFLYSLPNLVITDAEVVSINENLATYKYTIKNIGNETIPSLYYVGIQNYYSEDTIYANGYDVYAGARMILKNNSLAPGESFTYEASFIYQIPQGMKYLAIKLDIGNVVDESNEYDNTYAFPLDVPVNQIQNPDFESGNLTGWRTSGEAFSNGDVTSDTLYGKSLFKQQGIYHMLGSKEGGDSQTGSMRSSSFMLKGTAQGGCTVSFLTSGVNDINNLYVALVRASDDAILFKSTGENNYTYHMVNWDATKYIGTICYIKLVDNSTSQSINIDDVSIGDPRLPYNWIENSGFETGDLSGWITSGEAFSNGDVTSVLDYWGGAFNQQGIYHMWGYNEGGDGQTGTMRSSAFKIQGNYKLNFLISGGNDSNNLYVALVKASDGTILFKETGNNSETYRTITWDISSYAGTDCYIMLVDNSVNPWGHINIDGVKFSRIY